MVVVAGKVARLECVAIWIIKLELCIAINFVAMISISKFLLAFILLLSLGGCGESADVRYDRGFNDGYAAGYNTTCKIRVTLISGEWDDKQYSRGYRDGYSEGSIECNKK